MLQISSRVSIPTEEIELKAIRSQGAGGQNVNKVSTAVHLFFDIRASSLPEVYKERLLSKKDRRISPGGIVIEVESEHLDFTLPVEEVDVHHEITDEDHHNTHINGVKGPHEL